MQSWQRVFFFPLAVLVTAGLFLAMVGLIKSELVKPEAMPDLPPFAMMSPRSPPVTPTPQVKPPPDKPEPVSKRPANPTMVPDPIAGPNRLAVNPGKLTDSGLVAPALKFDGVLGGQNGKDSGLISRVRMRPLYPMAERAKGREGFVEVAFTVNDLGVVVDVEVIKSRPGKAFVQSVLKALYQWRYEPAMTDGRPVSTRVTERFEFSLTDE